MQSSTIPNLHDCTLFALERGLNQGDFTSVQLVEAYLARIAEVDHEFKSVIETNPDAVKIAQALDEERKTLGPQGSLHGIPILLKDNIVTLDSMEATCGSYALVGAKPEKESAVVTALREAGAIMLGKANLAEWAGFRSTSGCSGWSARGGQAQGIFYPGMKASGSSTGSAISTALGLTFASIGTETVFSIVSPAERCGIVGFKPTKDFIPSEGIIYASQRQDTVGLLTHSVEDAVDILLEIITHAGRDPSDRYRDQSDQDPTPGADCFESGDLKGLRIGAPNLSSFGLHECKIEDFINALLHLEKAGATLAHGVVIAGAEEHKALPQASKDIIQDTDLKLATNTYLSSLKTNPQNIKGLHDIIDFTKHCKAEEYPQRNVAVLERAQATDPEDGLYKKILTKDAYFTGEGGLAAALDRHNVDVLLVPSLSVTHQVFAAKAGSPVISVPMGYYPEGTGVERDPKNGFVTVAPGIPYSLYIYGRPGADDVVLRVAYVFEQLTNVRAKLRPYKLPTRQLFDFVGSHNA